MKPLLITLPALILTGCAATAKYPDPVPEPSLNDYTSSEIAKHVSEERGAKFMPRPQTGQVYVCWHSEEVDTDGNGGCLVWDAGRPGMAL